VRSVDGTDEADKPEDNTRAEEMNAGTRRRADEPTRQSRPNWGNQAAEQRRSAWWGRGGASSQAGKRQILSQALRNERHTSLMTVS
jgi:hypothetical protein